MLVAWIAYAALFGALLSIGALAAERVIAVWGGARRTVWCAAAVVGIAAPIMLALAPAKTSAAHDSADVRVSLSIPARGALGTTARRPDARRTRSTRPTTAALSRAARGWAAYSSSYALALWLGSSLMLLGAFVRGVSNVRRRRASWHGVSIDGCNVLVADDAGPAVVGAIRPSVVLPRWALATNANEQTLMLRHEIEHIAANDPLLLHAAAVALILFPWNAALWFIVHRLRLAIEIDCDARVLRDGARPRDYGLLLLSVGARHAVPVPFAASLAERRPLLEQRILAMTSIRPKRPLLASLPFAAIVLVVAAAAAQTPHPARMAPAAPSSPSVIPKATTPAAASVPALPAARSAAPAAIAQAIPPVPAIPANAASAASPAARAVPAVQAVPAASAAPGAIASPKPALRVPAAHTAEIPLEVIREWIARHHPGVIAGDTSMNLVMIVVDADDHYVKSITDHAPSNTVGPQATRPADLIDDVEVLKGPAAAMIYGPSAANGVIVIRTKRGLADSTHAAPDTAAALGIARSIQRSGIAANANAGAAPLIIVDGIIMSPPLSVASPAGQPGDLEARLGIMRDAIGSVDVLKLAPGRIAPNAVGVVIIKLKR